MKVSEEIGIQVSVLSQIEQWPADNAVSTVIDGSGQVLDSVGDPNRKYRWPR